MKLSHHMHGQLDPGSRDWCCVCPEKLDAGDVVLPGAEVHYTIFEIPMVQAVSSLPPAFHPSVPAVMGATFVKAPESPLGPFELAVVGLACRSGIRPRYMTVAAFASTDAAVDELRARFGYPARRAEVKSLVYYDKVISAVWEGGRPILEVSTGKLVTLTGPGATVVYCPALNMAELDSKRKFVQADISAEFKRVARGEPSAGTFDREALGRISFAPVDPVSGTATRADLTLHAVKYVVDPLIAAEDGGASKLRPSPTAQ